VVRKYARVLSRRKEGMSDQIENRSCYIAPTFRSVVASHAETKKWLNYREY
jgi:hypothetical protein